MAGNTLPEEVQAAELLVLGPFSESDRLTLKPVKTALIIIVT